MAEAQRDPPTIAMVTTDRKAGGIVEAFVNYADCITRFTQPVRLKLVVPEGAELLRRKLGQFDPGTIEVVTISDFEVFQIRRLGLVPASLKRALADCAVVVCHNNFLCPPLAGAERRIVAVCHTDRFKGLEASDRVIFLTSAAASAFAAQRGAAARRPDWTVLPHYFEARTPDNIYAAKPAAPFVACAAGRFVSNKGFRDFVRAAAILRGQGLDLRFVLAGEGEEAEALRRLSDQLGAGVEFPGWMDIGALADMAHVFCLTSEHEPFGYVLCEFMDRGIPCISTVTNGSSEILGSPPAGLIYPMGDAAALAMRIREVHDSRGRALELSDAAFRRIREPRFGKAAFMRRFEEALLGTTAERSSS